MDIKRSLVLALFLSSLALPGAARAGGEEGYSLRFGVLAGGRQLPTRLEAQTFSLAELTARRGLKGLPLVGDRLYLGSELALALPAGHQGWGEGLFALRAGLDFGAFAFSLGAQLRYSDVPAAALVVLPSLEMSYGRDQWSVSLGVLDQAQGLPLRLSFAWGNYGLSYAPTPMGLELWARHPLSEALSLEARAYGYELLAARMGGLTLGLRWTPGGAK